MTSLMWVALEPVAGDGATYVRQQQQQQQEEEERG